MNLVLCGFQGSGKSSCGKLAAETLSMPFFDTDSLLLDRFNEASIRSLYEKLGEEHFRKEECEVLKRIMNPCVLALGGGTIFSKNIGLCIYLYLPKQLLRIDPNAAFLKNTTLDALYEKRHPEYVKNCHFQLDISTMTIDQQVLEILALYGK